MDKEQTPYTAICDWCKMEIINPTNPVQLIAIVITPPWNENSRVAHIELNCFTKLMELVASLSDAG